jgi:hypothetical protein
MAGASALFYWDTCLFLAWRNDEVRKSGEMDGVREVIARHRRREVRLCTSVLTQVEILPSRMPAGLDPLFLDLMKRIARISLDTKIATMAPGLRDHYAQAGGKLLTTPDAIHLATASIWLRRFTAVWTSFTHLTTMEVPRPWVSCHCRATSRATG